MRDFRKQKAGMIIFARTVFANQYADCHISLHYDSTETDKGFFYISVPDAASYRASDRSADTLAKLAAGILEGVEGYYAK